MLRTHTNGLLDVATFCIYIYVVKFEWDDDKNNENIRKHGIDFVDVSKLDKTFFAGAQVRMPKRKKSVSLRLLTASPFWTGNLSADQDSLISDH